MSLDCLQILREPPADELTSIVPHQGVYDYASMYLGHHLSSINVNRIPDIVKSDAEDFLFGDDGVEHYATIWLETVKATFDSLSRAHPMKVGMEVI